MLQYKLVERHIHLHKMFKNQPIRSKLQIQPKIFSDKGNFLLVEKPLNNKSRKFLVIFSDATSGVATQMISYQYRTHWYNQTVRRPFYRVKLPGYNQMVKLWVIYSSSYSKHDLQHGFDPCYLAIDRAFWTEIYGKGEFHGIRKFTLNMISCDFQI